MIEIPIKGFKPSYKHVCILNNLSEYIFDDFMSLVFLQNQTSEFDP